MQQALNIISGIGGILFGISVVAFALECHGSKDIRLYGAIAGFVMSVVAISLGAQ